MGTVDQGDWPFVCRIRDEGQKAFTQRCCPWRHGPTTSHGHVRYVSKAGTYQVSPELVVEADFVHEVEDIGHRHGVHSSSLLLIQKDLRPIQVFEKLNVSRTKLRYQAKENVLPIHSFFLKGSIQDGVPELFTRGFFVRSLGGLGRLDEQGQELLAFKPGPQALYLFRKLCKGSPNAVVPDDVFALFPGRVLAWNVWHE